MILAKNDTARDYLGIHPNLDLALERINDAFFAQGREKVVIDPLQRQIQIGMNAQIITGVYILSKNHVLNPSQHPW